ncbi:hypothetical protein SDC9_95139 [bioreactor metagenome]|uniref:Uncharacterized protein n=1 Tax=bioreactor metagenome TaxID=1076179 RepID=A0A645AFG0_9ZZZZ
MVNSDFIFEVEQAISAYEAANNRVASRTREMFTHHNNDYVLVLSLLMKSPDLQQGFKVLRDTNQLEKTFEAVILRHKELFETEVIEVAQWRLSHPNDLLEFF